MFKCNDFVRAKIILGKINVTEFCSVRTLQKMQKNLNFQPGINHVTLNALAELLKPKQCHAMKINDPSNGRDFSDRGNPF